MENIFHNAENFIEYKISLLIMYKYYAKFSTHVRTQEEKAIYLLLIPSFSY